MGVDALRGNGITQKILYLLRDKTLVSPTEPLRKVRKSRVMMFVGVQLVGFGATMAVTQTIGVYMSHFILYLLSSLASLLTFLLPFLCALTHSHDSCDRVPCYNPHPRSSPHTPNPSPPVHDRRASDTRRAYCLALRESLLSFLLYLIDRDFLIRRWNPSVGPCSAPAAHSMTGELGFEL